MKIIINEAQLRLIIKEEVPYSLTKEYLAVERSPEALALLDNVFNKLKNLPNAKVTRSGNRVSFPYEGEPLIDKIARVLERYKYEIKDYDNNEAIRFSVTEKGTKEQPIKITKALRTIVDKDSRVEELLFLYSNVISGNISKKTNDLIIVFSKLPYDIATMSQDRSWEASCMNLIDGDNRRYVKLDIEYGTIICYVTKETDPNLKNPLGRVLIKPFINKDKEIVLYPEAKMYGKMDDKGELIKVIDKYMLDIQDLSGVYKRLGCLYDDSERDIVRDKELASRYVEHSIEYNVKLKEFEFDLATTEQKYRYIDARITNKQWLDEHEFMFATDEQRNRYIELSLEKELLSDFEFNFATREQKNRYIKILLDNNFGLSNVTFKAASMDQKEKHISLHNRVLYPKLFEVEYISKKEKYTHASSWVLHNFPIKKLPNELYINGYLDVINLGELTKISDKLITTRSLTLNNLNITSIADDLEVGGDLTIIRCKDLIKLPDGLFVDGDLQIIGCPQFEKYTDDKLREIIESTGGQVNGKIIK